MDVGIRAVADEDAVADAAAAGWAGAGDGELAHLHLDARAGDLDDDRVLCAGVGQSRRGLDEGRRRAMAQQGHGLIDRHLLDVGSGEHFQQVARHRLAHAVLLDGAVDAGHVAEVVIGRGVAGGGVPPPRFASRATGRAFPEEGGLVEGVVGQDAAPVGVGVAERGRVGDGVVAPGHHVAALDLAEGVAGDVGRAHRVEPPAGRTRPGEGDGVVQVAERVAADGARADVVGPPRAAGHLDGQAGLVGAGEQAIGEGEVLHR